MNPVSITTRASEIPADEDLEQQQEQEEVHLKGKVEKKAGRRVGYNYIIVKSYKESQKNDVVKCLYIKSLTKWGFCVIKEGSYGDTKDKDGRDIIDRLKWQKELHDKLQDKVRMPKLLGHFEERGNYYLVIGHIKGKPLYKVCEEKRRELREGLITGNKIGRQFLNYLIQIAAILESIHKEGIVHRDATPNNYMITSRGKVALIDMEMCYSIPRQFPTPAFALGTHGFMSKQQEAISVPTTAEDIFAFGAIMLQMWSGISPSKLTREPIDELSKKINFFVPDQQLANLVTQCLLPENDWRPNTSQIIHALKQYKADLNNKVTRPVNQPIFYGHDEILAVVQQAIHTLASPLLADEEKGWFSDDMTPPPAEDKHRLRKQWYASYNRGVSGVIYLLARAKGVGLDIGANLPFIEKGLELVKRKYIDRISDASAGLHFGSNGIAAVLVACIEEGLIEPSSEHLDWINQLLEKSSDAMDIEYGIAGQGIANLTSRAFISSQQLQKRLQSYAELLISKQHSEGCWTTGYYRQKYTRRKMKRVTKGFTIGMAGIVFFLLNYGHQCQHQPSKEAAMRGLQWLMKNAKNKKGTVRWTSARGIELDYNWSSGAAGIGLLFIKAFQLTNNLEYRKYAEKTLYNIPADIIDGNISQDSGLSGIGEVYLEAYRVFQNEGWLNRAGWIVQVLVQQKKSHPTYGTYWLVKGERQPVANFMIGNSGVIHFLLRYCFPEKIKFPLISE